MRLYRSMQKFLEVAVVVMLAIMCSMVFINVVLRYAFNTSLVSSEELSRFLFVWVTFTGAVLTLHENAHVNVPVFPDKLSPVVRKGLYAVIDLVMLVIVGFMLKGAVTQLVLNWQNAAPITGLPYGLNFLALVVSGLLMVAVLGVRSVGRWLPACQIPENQILETQTLAPQTSENQTPENKTLGGQQ